MTKIRITEALEKGPPPIAAADCRWGDLFLTDNEDLVIVSACAGEKRFFRLTEPQLDATKTIYGRPFIGEVTLQSTESPK